MRFKQSPLALLVAGLSASLWAADAVDANAEQSIKIEGKGVFAGGKMVYEEAAKARATVTKKAIEEKTSTANAYQLIDKLPGINAHSQDGSGLFGGTLTVRGFSASQMGFTVNGAPVNDSGGYEVYPMEYVDSENLEEIFVTQGTTDNDAPHIGATGGNVGLVLQKPQDAFRLRLTQTMGMNSLYKTFARIDTGKTGPVKSFISISDSHGNKWRGEGRARRFHIDANTMWNLGGGSEISGAVMYNKMDNHFLRRARMTDWQANREYDYDAKFAGRQIRPGVADNESGLTNYFELNRNPFENYQVTLKSKFMLSNNLSLDIDPYFWHGKGGGSSGTTLNETSYTSGMTGCPNGRPGRDLNGDGDCLDTNVLGYTISKTVTDRPGVTARLNWAVSGHKLMAAVWYEAARHRQTRPVVAVGANGIPLDIWADESITRADGSAYNGFSGGLARNWKTNTTVTQLTLQDGFDVGDNLSFLLGVRTPRTEREAISYGAGSEAEQAAFVRERGGQGGAVSDTRRWNQVLPNISAKYAINERSHAFVAISKNAKTPANFSLFESIQDNKLVGADSRFTSRELAPEKSLNVDLGYRYQGDSFNFNGSVFLVNFKDRQSQRTDDDGTKRNYNVGDTKKRGFELEFGTSQRKGVSFYGSASFIRERLSDDFVQYVGVNRAATGTTPETRAAQVALPTAGKTMTDAPKWLLGMGANYQKGGFAAGLGAKYTGKRYGDLMNQEVVPSSTVWDLNMAYKFASIAAMKRPTVRVAVSNLFDKNYLGGIPTTQINAQKLDVNNGLRVIDPGKNVALSVAGSAPSYDIGSPRFVSVSFTADF
ncbi:TonB-dependent receptor [Chitinimonas arctica]|uniref:TonB-dependent receptor n=1 Tax=Chitinimonas arctica TaxID=2594795 RepID=A0A516SIZ3_9NEIS|nr:TonB-dependent receptor [Chitinimonas arctica]QDQ28116.1 TonB-dependent receptor [Chitinimonas arctica]